jgi:transposase
MRLEGRFVRTIKVAKLVQVQIGKGKIAYGPNKPAIKAQGEWDGIYVVRTYKRLSRVEPDFGMIKGDDISVHPVWHHRADRVTAHLLICMLATYLSWHLRQAWAPLTFQDEHPDP